MSTHDSGEQSLVGNLSSASLSRDTAMPEHRARVWETAYRALSETVAQGMPGAWSPEEAYRTVSSHLALDVGAVDAHRQLPAGVIELSLPNRVPSADRIRVGIATIPSRMSGLEKVLDALLPQVDEIFVYINGGIEPPTSAYPAEKVRFFTGPDYGDRAKFLFAKGFEGYYLTCDDDIAYPSFYVDHLINGIEKYGRKAAVGWHGSIFSETFETYYDRNSRRVLAFYSRRPSDTPVHLLGTGCAAFHTSTVSVDFSAYTHPNMADVFFALEAQKAKVPLVVLKHEAGWATQLDDSGPSISLTSMGKVAGASSFNVAETVSELVRSNKPWSINKAPSLMPNRELLRVGIVGRTDRDRWKKGGILKSCHLMAAQLQKYGAHVELQDIETGSPLAFEDPTLSVIIIYVGDPNRPDFHRVEECVEHHAAAGRSVIINLTIQGRETRNAYVRDKLREWESRFDDRVVALTFTEAVRSDSVLKDVAHLLLPVPKTLTVPKARGRFYGSSGVFLGDIAKLTDPDLIDGDIHEWIAALRESLPGVPLKAVKQYRPKYNVELDVDEIWPHLPAEEFGERISLTRMMFTPVRYLSFEMVPTEVAGMGIPVLYPDMTHSLSEYLGLGGVQVRTPKELREVAPIVYGNPQVWRSVGRAGRDRVESQDLRGSAGQMYLRCSVMAARARVGISA